MTAGNEKARQKAGSIATFHESSLDRLHCRGLRTLRTLYYFETDFLALLQTTEALGIDRGIVNEHIFATVLGCNESKPFGIVEPFHSTGTHTTSTHEWDKCRNRSP